MIAIGTNTDPYQPIEKKHEIMRGILKVLAKFNHPVGIVTKGMMIERDIDILAPMAAKGLVCWYFDHDAGRSDIARNGAACPVTCASITNY